MLKLDAENFDKEIASGAVLVDFWAEWCGPCRMIAPVLEELKPEYEGKMRIGKLNVDQNQPVAVKFGVMSIPTLILFKDGQPSQRIVGYMPKKELKAKIDKGLEA